MERVSSMIQVVRNQVVKYGRPLFSDWLRITFLMQAIGSDIFFFIGLAVAKISCEIPFIKELLLSFQEGLNYGSKANVCIDAQLPEMQQASI
jgi:hypothetical protein